MKEKEEHSSRKRNALASRGMVSRGETEKRDKTSREKSPVQTRYSKIEGKQCCLVDEASSENQCLVVVYQRDLLLHSRRPSWNRLASAFYDVVKPSVRKLRVVRGTPLKYVRVFPSNVRGTCVRSFYIYT